VTSTVRFDFDNSFRRELAELGVDWQAAEASDPAVLIVNEELAEEGIQVSQLIIGGAIDGSDPKKSPEALAEQLWSLHTERNRFRVQIATD
jgi:hypothetical protein